MADLGGPLGGKVPLPQGWWGWGEWGTSWREFRSCSQSYWILCPLFLHSHVLELQPQLLLVAGALSESLECSGRGQESRGHDPLTTQARPNLPTCVSRGAVARPLVAVCATSPSRQQRQCHICFFQGNLVLQRGG